MGRIDDRRVEHHYDVVRGRYELDTRLPSGVDPQRLITLMGRDKKALGGEGLTFVLDSDRGVEVVSGVAVGAARDVLDAMTEQ